MPSISRAAIQNTNSVVANFMRRESIGCKRSRAPCHALSLDRAQRRTGNPRTDARYKLVGAVGAGAPDGVTGWGHTAGGASALWLTPIRNFLPPRVWAGFHL